MVDAHLFTKHHLPAESSGNGKKETKGRDGVDFFISRTAGGEGVLPSFLGFGNYLNWSGMERCHHATMGDVAADEKLRNDANKPFLSMPARRGTVHKCWQVGKCKCKCKCKWTGMNAPKLCVMRAQAAGNAISSTDQSTTFPDH